MKLFSSRCVVNSLLALAALTMTARADDTFEVTLVGHVYFVVGDGETKSDLAALGVMVNTPVTASVSIDTSAAPVPLGASTQYTGATASLAISIGGYGASHGSSAGDVIEVGDDISNGDGVEDTYTVSTFGSDSNAILSDPGELSISLSFFDQTAAAGSDEALVQDLSEYTLASASIGGERGSISILWTGVSIDGCSSIPTSASCREAFLKTLSKFGKSSLACRAKSAGQPAQVDPFGEKLAGCLADASKVFDKVMLKAAAKALKQGGLCAAPTKDGVDADADVHAVTETIATALTAGANNTNKADRTLRSKLLKASSALWKRDAAAYAKDAKKPSLAKLISTLAASRVKFVKQFDKAVVAAEKKSVTYAGPTSESVVNDLRSSIEEWVTLAGGVIPDAP